MKDKLSGVNQPKKLEREKWMTELPPVLKVCKYVFKETLLLSANYVRAQTVAYV